VGGVELGDLHGVGYGEARESYTRARGDGDGVGRGDGGGMGARGAFCVVGFEPSPLTPLYPLIGTEPQKPSYSGYTLVKTWKGGPAVGEYLDRILASKLFVGWVCLMVTMVSPAAI